MFDLFKILDMYYLKLGNFIISNSGNFSLGILIDSSIFTNVKIDDFDAIILVADYSITVLDGVVHTN